MPIDLSELVGPERTALVLQEVQNGVVGERSVVPALAEEVRRTSLIAHCAHLERAARGVGVPVSHCTAETRADGKGANRNARLFAGVRKWPVPLEPGSDAVRVPTEIAVEVGHR